MLVYITCLRNQKTEKKQKTKTKKNRKRGQAGSRMHGLEQALGAHSFGSCSAHVPAPVL